jgi:hypothetical protein
VHQGDTSAYIRYGVLNTLSVSIAVMDMGKETIITKGWKLLLDAFQFVGISSHNRIPNKRGVFKLRSN